MFFVWKKKNMLLYIWKFKHWPVTDTAFQISALVKKKKNIKILYLNNYNT